MADYVQSNLCVAKKWITGFMDMDCPLNEERAIQAAADFFVDRSVFQEAATD